MPKRTPGGFRSPALVAVLSTIMLAACASGSGASPAAVSPAAGSPAAAPSSAGGGSAGAATIKNFAFSPASITVAAGTTVTWTNEDTTDHTVTAEDGSFDSKATASGATFSQTFDTAGTFAYHCTIHPAMKGTVVVQ